jgi:salicylate hydroxylase
VEFSDGARVDGLDALIGSDGIHSVVRTSLFGAESPRFTGVVAFRTVVPTERVRHVPDIGAFTKWWGPTPDSQIVTFPLNQGRDTFIFATTAQESWHEESWTTEAAWPNCAAFMLAFIHMPEPCWMRVTACSRRLCMSATRCRTGRRGECRCSEMPAIP